LLGTAIEVKDEEKYHALLKLAEKYSPDFMPEAEKYVKDPFDKTTVIKININSITGKAKR